MLDTFGNRLRPQVCASVAVDFLLFGGIHSIPTRTQTCAREGDVKSIRFATSGGANTNTVNQHSEQHNEALGSAGDGISSLITSCDFQPRRL